MTIKTIKIMNFVFPCLIHTLKKEKKCFTDSREKNNFKFE